MTDAEVQAKHAFNRSRAGAVARHNGEMFEQIFELRCRSSGIAVTRLPDGCKSAGRGKIRRIKTDFDWILTHKGQTALLDTKTYQHDNLRPSDLVEHQVAALLNHRRHGGLTGYVVWFRRLQMVSFAPVEALRVILETGNSIHGLKLFQLGSVSEFKPTLLFDFEKEAPDYAT